MPVTPNAKRVRVLVADDSALIRELICDLVSATEDLEVVGRAADGRQVVELVQEVSPDVITLDIQMPHMDGLATLQAVLAQRPVPVVMVSSLTQRGAEITFEALDGGAVDYVPKPESLDGADAFRDELLRKIRTAAGTDVHRIMQIRQERKARREQQRAMGWKPKAAPLPDSAELADACIALGISTGGPPALASVFETLQPPMPPIVVVQHMPPGFTRSLAWRLNALSQLDIKEAEAGDFLQVNRVLVAPGGTHLLLKAVGPRTQVVLRDGPTHSGHKPSIDLMMQSAAPIFRARCLGIIMTGMGRDGADGCRAIRAAGGFVLGQDEESSDVYGMNKVAHVEGNVDRQFALGEAAAVIVRQVRRLAATQGTSNSPARS